MTASPSKLPNHSQSVQTAKMAVEIAASGPTGKKRGHEDSGDESPSSTMDLKRRKIEPLNTTTDSLGESRLGTIASVISGVFGYRKESQEAVSVDAPAVPSSTTIPLPAEQKPPTASAPIAAPLPNPVPSRTLGRIEIRLPTSNSSNPSRPAIKLSALQGPTKKATAKAAGRKKAVGRPPKKPKAQINDDYPYINHQTNNEFSESILDSAENSPIKHRAFAGTPRGILTPTKNRGIRSSKSVTFDKRGEVFFADLPKSPVFKKPQARRQRKDDDEDGITCGICAKPHSRPPNEIILCDNCDFAVHQECYSVPEIPEGDWLCKSCSQEDILATPKKSTTEPASTATQSARPFAAPDIPNLDTHWRSLQRILLDRCTGQRHIRMYGQEEPAEKIRQLLEQTVLAGEGNSMLVIGPRGSGKTTLVEETISDLSKQHKHEFHVVRLNGFIHTDDKLALKEIWRQLGKEMEVEDDLLSRSNYADTMASLLAVLSHPSEISGKDDGMTSQSVLFVIDEFDMFAAHPRQTLLYNLFDIAQSRKAPIAVLGCTTRLDVVETLEKRVKSRFSHRYVYLAPPRSLLSYWQICRQGLMLGDTDRARQEMDKELEGCDAFLKYWNHKIEELYKERTFQDVLQYHYYTTKSAAAFFTEWILPLSLVSSKDLTLNIPTAGGEFSSLAPPDSRMELLSSLSDLDLSLLIAAARLDIIAHTDTVNFAMAYDEYSGIVGRQRVQSATSGLLAVSGSARVWSRGVAGIAWERLISLGLLVPSGVGGGGRGLGGLEGRMWKVDVALEEIPPAVKLNAAMAKWCKEI